MGSAEIQKTKLQITERMRHPSELRRGRLSNNGPRNFSVNGGPPRHRAILRPADRTDSQHQPPPKRRLSSAAVVKVDDGEIIDDVEAVTDVINRKDLPREDNDGACTEHQSERKPSNLQKSGWSRRDGNQRAVKMDGNYALNKPLNFKGP